MFHERTTVWRERSDPAADAPLHSLRTSSNVTLRVFVAFLAPCLCSGVLSADLPDDPIVFVDESASGDGFVDLQDALQFARAESATRFVDVPEREDTRNGEPPLIDMGVYEAAVSTARKIYWCDSKGIIQRANLDGTEHEVLISSLPQPTGIALDVADGKMYLTDVIVNQILRANLDGSGLETLVVIAGSSNPVGIALDLERRHMYWTDELRDRIERANFDGTGRQILLTGLPSPGGLSLDLVGGKMYWAEEAGSIQRANLDGTGTEVVVPGLDCPTGVALDLIRGKMYWHDRGTDLIQRANLDGTAVEVVRSRPGGGVLLDASARQMYWTDVTVTMNRGEMYCADADGDEEIGLSDLLLVLAQWGPCPPVCPGDIDGDGVVGVQDLLAVLSAWGKTCREELFTMTALPYGMALDLTSP